MNGIQGEANEAKRTLKEIKKGRPLELEFKGRTLMGKTRGCARMQLPVVAKSQMPG